MKEWQEEKIATEYGLTKREWFAGQVLQGYLANPLTDVHNDSPFDIAEHSLYQADIIIKKLNNEKFVSELNFLGSIDGEERGASDNNIASIIKDRDEAISRYEKSLDNYCDLMNLDREFNQGKVAEAIKSLMELKTNATP